MLGLGPRLMKKILPGRGLTKVEKHWCRRQWWDGIVSLLRGEYVQHAPEVVQEDSYINFSLEERKGETDPKMNKRGDLEWCAEGRPRTTGET